MLSSRLPGGKLNGYRETIGELWDWFEMSDDATLGAALWVGLKLEWLIQFVYEGSRN